MYIVEYIHLVGKTCDEILVAVFSFEDDKGLRAYHVCMPGGWDLANGCVNMRCTNTIVAGL